MSGQPSDAVNPIHINRYCRITDYDKYHYWDPESTLESMQWKHVDCSPRKKFKSQPAASKSYNDNFGDFEELHMVDYLPSKKTIIGQCYAEIMFKLYDAISKKCRENVK